MTKPRRKPKTEDQIEKAAADLWRKENPDMSVFSVTPEMKAEYIHRIREGK